MICVPRGLQKTVTKNDYKYMDKARHIAEFSDYGSIRHGCVAVYKGHIIGTGYNTNKTHPMQLYYNKYREITGHMSPKLHAEINCLNQLRHLDIDFKKVKLYIYRSRNDRSYSLSRPCPSCMAAIRDLGIRNIYYTTDDGFANEKILDDIA